MRETETDFETWLVDLAKLLGWMAYHTRDSRRSNEGFPDWVLAKPGRVIFAELKSEEGKLTVEQGQWLALLETSTERYFSGSPVEAYVWRPSDRDRIMEVLT